ncbi:MAG: ABC transporter ATP-binding protein [Gemmatales bacterium]|nr:MAG: ABC transporter ATP-binding protein [Gemmatales bacterium]
MSEPIYRLMGVRRRLGAFELHIEELSIYKNDVLVLLGPTGSGKTTLVKILTGLEPPDEGCVEYKSESLGPHASLARSRQIALAPQRPIMFRGSVFNNVAFGPTVRGRKDDAIVREILRALELSDLARQDARTLSVGQSQLVAVARALACQPEVLLLDEPTTNLDPARVALVENIIASMRKQNQLTVVWATHNLFQARRVGTRAAFILNGELIEVGNPPEFFDQPRDPRTRAFMEGRMVY